MDEIIEYLRALSKDAIVKVSVMDKASMARNSIVIDGVVDGGVWCREDIGTLIEDNGKNPTPENIDKVLAAVPGGLGSFQRPAHARGLGHPARRLRRRHRCPPLGA